MPSISPTSGSTIGRTLLGKATLLFKAMGLSETHGARHLAEAHEGRAAHWRAFKDALDAVEFSEAEDAC